MQLFLKYRVILLYYGGSRKNYILGLIGRIQQRKRPFKDTILIFFLLFVNKVFLLAELKIIVVMLSYVTLLWTDLDVRGLCALTDQLSKNAKWLPGSVST